MDKILRLFLAATQHKDIKVDDLCQVYLSKAERNVDCVAEFLDLMAYRSSWNEYNTPAQRHMRREQLHAENIRLINQQRRLA